MLSSVLQSLSAEVPTLKAAENTSPPSLTQEFPGAVPCSVGSEGALSEMSLRGEGASHKTQEELQWKRKPAWTERAEVDSRRGNVLRHWGSPEGAANTGETCGLSDHGGLNMAK